MITWNKSNVRCLGRVLARHPEQSVLGTSENGGSELKLWVLLGIEDSHVGERGPRGSSLVTLPLTDVCLFLSPTERCMDFLNHSGASSATDAENFTSPVIEFWE